MTPSGNLTPFDSQLNGPEGVAVDGTGDVFIADTGDDRVMKVTRAASVTVNPVQDHRRLWRQPAHYRPGGDLHRQRGRGQPGRRHAHRHGHVPGRRDGLWSPPFQRRRRWMGRATSSSPQAPGLRARTITGSTVEVTAGISGALSQTVNPLTAANLQTVLATTSTVTLDAATNTDAQTILTAVNSLSAPASPVTITVNLASGSFTDLTASPPAGVTLVLNGNGTTTTIVGHSPALTVIPSQGSVVVENQTFTTDTDAPTILVSGGSLTLHNDVIQESTGFTDAAISVTGGSVDLGTAASPGGNILDVNGTGEFVHNTTAASIPATGDTFEIDGTPIAAPYLSFTSLASSGTTTVYGQAVTLTATVRANTTPGSGTPTGSVDFFDVSTGTDLGTAPLSGGSAALTTAALGAGNYLIRALYSGDSNFTLSLDALTQTVNRAATATQVTSSADPAVPGQAVTFTATVANIGGTPATPAGTVQFVVDGSNLGTPVTVDATGHATSPAVSFPAGTSHTVNAFYVDPASNFAGSNTTLSPLTQIVLAPGISVSGTTLYVVGGSIVVRITSPPIKPAGGRNDGWQHRGWRSAATAQ